MCARSLYFHTEGMKVLAMVWCQSYVAQIGCGVMRTERKIRAVFTSLMCHVSQSKYTYVSDTLMLFDNLGFLDESAHAHQSNNIIIK